MAATIYNYDKNQANISLLVAQITEAGIAGPDHCVFNVDETPTNLHLYYNNELEPADKSTLDGVVAAHDGSALPPPSEQYVTMTDEIQTNSIQPEDAVVMTTPIFPPGNYIVEWSAELKVSKNNNLANMKVSIDGGDTLCDGGYDRSRWGLCSGFDKITTIQYSAITVRLQYCSESGGNVAAYIRRAALRLKPMET